MRNYDASFQPHPHTASAAETPMERNATCCCGNVSIRVKGDPSLHALCHCNNCRKRTGSAFGISAYFPNSAILEKNGVTKMYAIDHKKYKHQQQRHFCPQCGTTLFWTISTLPDLTGVAGGCFADNPLPAPTHTLFHEKKCAWLQLPDDWQTSIQSQGK